MNLTAAVPKKKPASSGDKVIDLNAKIRVLQAYIAKYTSHSMNCARLKAEQEGRALLPQCDCGFFRATEILHNAMNDANEARVLAKQDHPFASCGPSGAGGGIK